MGALTCLKQGPGATPHCVRQRASRTWQPSSLPPEIAGYRRNWHQVGSLATRETTRGACPSPPLWWEQSSAGAWGQVLSKVNQEQGVGEAGTGLAGDVQITIDSHVGSPDYSFEQKILNIRYERNGKKYVFCMPMHTVHLCWVASDVSNSVRLYGLYVARQAPLFMEFSRQEYWSGLPCPPPRYLPNPRIEPVSLCLLHWQAGFLPLAPPGLPSEHILTLMM